MVVLLTILGTIFLIVSAIFWSETPKLRTVSIVIATVAAILMTLCYVGSVLAQYIFANGTFLAQKEGQYIGIPLNKCVDNFGNVTCAKVVGNKFDKKK